MPPGFPGTNATIAPEGAFMKRCLVTLVVFVLCLVPLHADLTFTQTMTIEGPLGAMMAGKPMLLTTRVKGAKVRLEMDAMDTKITSLSDLKTGEITVLNHQDKTAQVISAATMPEVSKMIDVDVSFEPTGQTRAIDGVQTHEHAFKMSFDFGEMMRQGAQSQPKENAGQAGAAAEMMKGMKMLVDGSVWIAKSGPGAAEYMAFQKAALDANFTAALAGMMGGQQARGGMDKLLRAITEAPGLPYLTEMAMSIDGTGPMVDMLKQQLTGTKMIQKISSISTDALADDQFSVPEGYTIKK
jgi:hypothetical protein